jgi:hypothetical protein
MFELCRAINEREAALGFDGVGLRLAPTKFRKPDGTLASNLSMSDLLNLPCTGPNNYALQNMIGITGWITGRCGLFTQSSGYSSIHTQSTLETAIGASLDFPTRVNEARWWQAVQDALDLLIHPWGYMIRDNAFSTGADSENSGTGVNHNTIADAWAALGANTATWTGASPGAYANPGTSSGTWRAAVQPSVNINYACDTVRYDGLGITDYTPTGTVISTRAIYSTSTAQLASSVDFEIDGNNVFVSGAVTDAEISVTPLSFTSDTTINVTFGTPISSPFNEETSAFGDSTPREVSLTLSQRAKIYFDIADELTDQA